MNPDKAAEFLMGRPGTDVKLSVLHEGSEDPDPMTITRAIIEVPTVISDRRKPDDQFDFMLDKDKKIGYIRVTTFSQNTAEELKKALDQLKEEGVRGLVLDLRDDPGGLLSAAVEVADMFLEKGEIVTTKGRNTAAKKFEAQKDGLYEDLPMVVLVNQNSASASEIVSAALQDHKRAEIVGQRSYGKGSVQNIIDLDGGTSVLKLTVASYYRPSGENIHKFKNAKNSDKWGVSPSEGAEVKLPNSEYIRWFIARRERDLESAAKGHRKATFSTPATEKAKGADGEKPKDKGEAKTDDKKDEAKAKVKSPHEPAGPFVDRQRDKALEIIRAKIADAKPKAA
jgi:carboxyl-terminal processing protease